MRRSPAPTSHYTANLRPPALAAFSWFHSARLCLRSQETKFNTLRPARRQRRRAPAAIFRLSMLAPRAVLRLPDRLVTP